MILRAVAQDEEKTQIFQSVPVVDCVLSGDHRQQRVCVCLPTCTKTQHVGHKPGSSGQQPARSGCQHEMCGGESVSNTPCDWEQITKWVE